jgi:diguanylate cyclase (GGDEF)-like protein
MNEMTDLLNRSQVTGFDARRTASRHLVMSLLVILAETLMCLGYSFGGYVSIRFLPWLSLMVAIWLISLFLAWLVRNNPPSWLRGRRQVMVLTLWAISCFLVTSFYLNQFRISAIMFFFPILLMSSFRLSRLALLGVCSYAALGYLVVLVLVMIQRSVVINPSVEGLQWIIFAATTFSFVISGSAVSRASRRLSQINHELEHSVRMAQEAAIHDELTGLFNRRHIMEILQQQKAMADAGNYDFVICYLDLDHFKTINDTYGHGVGDHVLQKASQLLLSGLREADYCARLGGEEFVLVLTGTGLVSASQVVERLRERLAHEEFDQLMGGRRVTLSAGLTQYRPGESVSGLLTRADHCLYQSKATGRNRITVCGD